MFYKLLNDFSYIFFASIYLLLFCFIFKTKLNNIIFILLSVTTIFLTLQFLKDILTEFFTVSSKYDNNMTKKYFNIDFMKPYPLFYIIFKMVMDIPIFVYIPICLGLIYMSFIFTYIIFLESIQSNDIQDTLNIPLSSLNIKKINTMKTLFIFDIIFLFILLFILKYVPNEMFSKNKGVNTANGISLFSTFSIVTISIYLFYIDMQLYGMQHQIADGSS